MAVRLAQFGILRHVAIPIFAKILSALLWEGVNHYPRDVPL
jgi:hypothetical protein